MQGTALETRGEVTATAYDASGTRMVTSTAEGAVHVWDREDDLDEATEGAPGPWRQTAAWAAHDDVSCEAIAFAPAEFGQCVATAAADGSVRVWREKPLAPLGAEPAVATEAAAAAAAAAREGAAPWELVADLREARARARRSWTSRPRARPSAGCRRRRRRRALLRAGNTLALLGWELTNEAEALGARRGGFGDGVAAAHRRRRGARRAPATCAHIAARFLPRSPSRSFGTPTRLVMVRSATLGS